MTPLDQLVYNRSFTPHGCEYSTPLDSHHPDDDLISTPLLRPAWEGSFSLDHPNTHFVYFAILLENGALGLINFIQEGREKPYTILQQPTTHHPQSYLNRSLSSVINGEKSQTTLEIYLTTAMYIIRWHDKPKQILKWSLPKPNLSGHQKMLFLNQLEQYRVCP